MSWTPENLTNLSHLKGWLKADSLSLNDGIVISSWLDSSSNGQNATQSDGAKRPIYKLNILNSLPIIRFDGIDDYLLFTNDINLTRNTLYSIYCVCKRN